jgi:hypothetical protein
MGKRMTRAEYIAALIEKLEDPRLSLEEGDAMQTIDVISRDVAVWQTSNGAHVICELGGKFFRAARSAGQGYEGPFDTLEHAARDQFWPSSPYDQFILKCDVKEIATAFRFDYAPDTVRINDEKWETERLRNHLAPARAKLEASTDNGSMVAGADLELRALALETLRGRGLRVKDCEYLLAVLAESLEDV